jgi:ACR3 family arsenite efflux pump ArsB
MWEEVQLHTLLTLYSCPAHHCMYVNLPSTPQHSISYQMEQVTLSLITYLGIPVFMGYDFWRNLPTQPGTKWDFGTI